MRPRPRWLALLASLLLACGITPNQTIADEFHERLVAQPAPGYKSLPCKDREEKLASASELVWIAQDLRARIREFPDPPPPRLRDIIMQTPMLGRAHDVRCVIQDFASIDLFHEPDTQDVLDLIANAYVLKAMALLEMDQPRPAWAHMIDALHLYRKPLGPNLPEFTSLGKVLHEMATMLEAHPPQRATAEELIRALEATRVGHPLVCSALRHELLTIGVWFFRVHLGNREKQAMAKRFGLRPAMWMWQSPWPGKLDHALWTPFRDAYDAMIDGCERRSLGHTVLAGADPMWQLDRHYAPLGVRTRVAVDRLNQIGVLSDMQIGMLSRLRTMVLRDDLGRPPTTAELMLSFGRRPRNAWDLRPYRLTLEGDVLTMERGPHRHTMVVPPLAP